jgi:excisionase family DNA binding protein
MGPRRPRNRATRTDNAHDGGPGVVLGRAVPTAEGERGLGAARRVQRHRVPPGRVGRAAARPDRELDRSGWTSIPAAAEEQLGRLAAGGTSEPPSPAETRTPLRLAAPFTTLLLSDPEKGHAPSSRRGTAGKRSRGVELSGREDLNLRPFGPETAKLTCQSDGIVYNHRQSLQIEGGGQSSASQGLGGLSKDCATRLLPNSSATAAHGGAQAGGVGAGRQRGVEGVPRASTAATLGDLQVLWGGRDRLLRVAEVAEHLAVGAWAVYKLCEDGDLPHVRINNSIRVRPGDLSQFVAARRRAKRTKKGRLQE